jgi:DNA-binding LytR/AlgR family response regulator
VIAEDEAVIARRIARLTADILGPAGAEILIAPGISEARESIERDAPELLILDLNLEGDDGFHLVRELSVRSFDTIVISAHRERALEAFEYGVRDFIAKPFTRERLEQALRRVLAPATRGERPIEHIGVRREGAVEFISVEKVMFIRGAGTRSELIVTGGRTVLHDKLLDRLEGVLPPRFERIHKSYIVDIARVRRLFAQEGSRYSVELVDGTVLPVGRTRVAALRARLA